MHIGMKVIKMFFELSKAKNPYHSSETEIVDGSMDIYQIFIPKIS